jgi:hypothetical protein
MHTDAKLQRNGFWDEAYDPCFPLNASISINKYNSGMIQYQNVRAKKSAL